MAEDDDAAKPISSKEGTSCTADGADVGELKVRSLTDV